MGVLEVEKIRNALIFFIFLFFIIIIIFENIIFKDQIFLFIYFLILNFLKRIFFFHYMHCSFLSFMGKPSVRTVQCGCEISQPLQNFPVTKFS